MGIHKKGTYKPKALKKEALIFKLEKIVMLKMLTKEFKQTRLMHVKVKKELRLV